MTKAEQIRELRERADRVEESVSSTDGPSSQEWVSPERRSAYLEKAREYRAEAHRLERE